MRALGLSLSGLACVVALIVLTPGPANSQPSAPVLAQTSAGAIEQVRHRYWRYRYGYRPYYPYYRPYAYYRPYYYRPYYYGYPYYYRPYYRPGFSFWF